MIAQVCGPLDEDDPVRRRPKDCDDHGGLPANRVHVSELAQKTCVPCRGGVPPLTGEQIAPLLAQVDADWRVVERPDAKRGTVTLLQRAYRTGDFAEALAGADRIGAIAEEQQHHPDLHVAWGRLGVEIWTHKIGGLTESDFVFAAKCDAAMAGNEA
jgi:4a-hydroxytetrahydrobiopterin dehydratase